MSLSKSEAEEILDYCLKNESPEFKVRVYEVLSKSGIQTNDPMFLVLALTGQIRVLLEIAPSELRELLNTWRSVLDQSMSELNSIIVEVKEAQQQQIKSIQQGIEEINLKNVHDIRNLHQSLVTYILESNSSIESKIQTSFKEIAEVTSRLEDINTQIENDRNNNIKVIKSLVEGMTKTTKELELANSLITSSVITLDKLKLSKFINRGTILITFIIIFVFGNLSTLVLIKLIDRKPEVNTRLKKADYTVVYRSN